MTVIFPIAEDYVPQIIPQVYAGKILSVQAYDRQQSQLLATGKLLALNNQIDPTTGTVKLRAVFDNKENKLFPNQFVNVKILVDTLQQAILVPTSAVQHTTTEDFVYVLNKDNTVTAKVIVMGPASEDDTVITSGLAVGQQVVVDGADKLMNGSKIIVQATKVMKKTESRSVT
jgi:multidrug efflux system membrane fusion protein